MHRKQILGSHTSKLSRTGAHRPLAFPGLPTATRDRPQRNLCLGGQAGLTAALHWELDQMDFKAAFLHGNFEETVHVPQPTGFAAEGQENEACKLVIPLYGLMQSPWQSSASSRLFKVWYGLKQSPRHSPVRRQTFPQNLVQRSRDFPQGVSVVARVR